MRHGAKCLRAFAWCRTRPNASVCDFAETIWLHDSAGSRDALRVAARFLKVVRTCISIVNYFSSSVGGSVFLISKNEMTMIWSLALEGEATKPRESANDP